MSKLRVGSLFSGYGGLDLAVLNVLVLIGKMEILLR
jgi:site-specific DNA-cytosine methylase